MSTEQNGLKAGTPSPARLGSALVRSAKKCHELAWKFSAADAELKRLMQARYGFHDEMPDPIVEVTQYGAGGGTITLKWLDEMMSADGYPPNT